MKFKILVVSLFLSGILAAQDKKIPSLGKADIDELNLKFCAFDKSAGALKIFDIEKKEVIADYGLKIKTERRIRIKIFNQSGFSAATVNIPYVSQIKGTKVTNIDAYIYYLNNNGEVITQKVSKHDIYKDELNEFVTSIKFTFPNVKEGCVVEYRYEKVEKNSLHLDPWYFQDVLPVQFSSRTLLLPSYIDFEEKIFGTDSVNTEASLKKQGTGNQLISKTYSLSNIVAFKPEPFMTSVADNLKRIEFAIQPSGFGFMSVLMGGDKWKIYARILAHSFYFGKQFSKIIAGTEAIVDSAKQMESKDERIKYIFEKVKKKVKWNNQQTFYAGNIDEVWAEGTGNSADINLIVLNLLRKSNITCSPLLISTRANGQATPDFFSMSQFNGVDVLIMDSTTSYVLDGTRKYQSYKTPPENILNRYAFNADTASADWVFVSDARPLLKTIMNIKATLDDDGTIKGETYAVFYDHSKVMELSEENKTDEDKKEEEKEFLSKDFTELKIDSLLVENKEDDFLPLTEQFVFSYKPSQSDDFLFIDPDFLSRFRKNPFADSIRHFSIDFNSIQYLKTSFSLTIPDNYEIDHLPPGMRLRAADSSIIFEKRIIQSGNKIAYSISLEILNPIFEKEEYGGLKDFFNRMYASIGDQIIVKRKK